MNNFVLSIVSGVLVSLAGSAALAYTHACLPDQVMKTVSCEGTAKVGQRNLGFQVVLQKGTSKQNPQALPVMICNQLGPVTNFTMYIRDSSNGRTMGFFSKYGSNHIGAQGDKPEIDTLFSTGLLSLRAYAFDYGDFVKGDQVIFVAGPNGVHAKVRADLQENTGEGVLALDADLNCVVQ